MHFYHQFNDLDIAGIYDYEPLLHYFDFPESLEGKNVLDIGCATGFFSRHFENKGGRVTSCDVNVSAVRHIKERLNLKLDIVECDVYDLDLGCNFDFIFCGSLLLHTFYPMWLLRIINKHLRPKGTFILTTFYAEGEDMIVHCYPHLGRPKAECEKEIMSSYQSLWHPTIPAMKNMVALAGFEEVHCVNTYMLSSTEYGEQIGHGYHTPHCILRSCKGAEAAVTEPEKRRSTVRKLTISKDEAALGNTEIGSVARHRDGSGAVSWAYKNKKWQADNINTYPPKDKLSDIEHIFKEYIAQGHIPEEPILYDWDNVITFGSCFAAELRYFLHRFGLSSDGFWVPAGLNNTYAVRDFLTWCITGEQERNGYWYDRDESGEINEWTPMEEQVRYREYLKRAGCIVLTLGLAEVWEDKTTKGVFWRGVPAHIFDEKRHAFRLTTVEENYSNISRTVELVRSELGDMPIVITLSPVPLHATFRKISCMTADCVSKSTLRVAINQVMEKEFPGVYYWPSFEMVRWYGCHLSSPAFGMDDPNVRHVSRWIVVNIIKAFVECFFDRSTFQKFEKHLNEMITPKESAEPYAITGKIVEGV